MQQRVQDVADLFRAEPSELKNVFDESFLAKVPPSQLTAIFKSYFDKYGSVVRTRRLGGDEQQAVCNFTFTKGVVVKVTLHTLSTLMISESDNTTTDQLLQTLGRERVEATMARMGVRDAARNRPLLSTLEMFKLKAGSDATAATTWTGLDEVGKRNYLAGPIATMNRAHVQSWNTPRHLDQVEWFASAADLARSLMWLRDHSEAGNAAVARGVLAINPGIPLDKTTWPYVGFKGGSEPGVVAAAYLPRHRNGSWWTLTGAWNNPTHEVEVERFFGLLERATEILAEGLPVER